MKHFKFLKQSRFFFVSTLLFVFLRLDAAPCLLEVAAELVPIKSTIAVELETSLSPNLMRIITTTDGTTGALL